MTVVVSWPEQIVARLAVLLEGCPRWDERYFKSAWQVALRDCPPRGRDVAAEGTPHLFDEAGQREESLVDAMYRFCRDAWLGERPALARFEVGLLADLDLMGLWADAEEPALA